jgi:hypothetical protein
VFCMIPRLNDDYFPKQNYRFYECNGVPVRWIRPIKYYLDQFRIHSVDLGNAYGILGNAYSVLVGEPEGKRPLGRPRRRWVDNIKMDLREIG